MVTSKKHQFLLKSASYFSVINAAIILLIKLYGWVATDAVSILASLIDACLDISSSIINFIAIRVSLLPPDNNHRFGHEKIQDLAVFAQAIFFGASSIFLIFTSIKKMSSTPTLENHDLGIAVMLVSTILTSILVAFQTYVISKTKSNIIEADKLHYLSDIFTNLAVIISIFLSSSYGFKYADPIFALIISIYILHGAYGILVKAIRNLADEEFQDKDRGKILKIISKNPNVKGIHELKTRYAAHKPFIQFHLELEGSLNLYDAHIITDEIMDDLYKAFPGCEIIIHQDPAGVERNVPFKEMLPNK